MPTKSDSSPPETAASLKELLDQHPVKLRNLFVKTLMLHAGHQVGAPKSEKEIIALIRKEIEQTLDA
jgi:flagellar basal body-associated protein FliL